MNNNIKKRKYMNFLDKYEKTIRPKLKEIDIFVKCMEDYATPFETASILNISEIEVKLIMSKLNILEVNRFNFFQIMENGSSFICKLYKREITCGSPLVYTKEEIAYIYNLDINKVTKACKLLNIKEATAYTLPILFSKIS